MCLAVLIDCCLILHVILLPLERIKRMNECAVRHLWMPLNVNSSSAESWSISLAMHGSVKITYKLFRFNATFLIYRVAQKVSHFQVSSLFRIKTRQSGYIFHRFLTIKWAQEYNKSVLNFLCDLICDVITCCVWSCNIGKINSSD